MPDVSQQLIWLFVLAAPVASIAWTVTHEELFGELHHWCERKSQRCASVYQRKFFYLFTCEYCFSHYVAAGMSGSLASHCWCRAGGATCWRG